MADKEIKHRFRRSWIVAPLAFHQKNRHVPGDGLDSAFQDCEFVPFDVYFDKADRLLHRVVEFFRSTGKNTRVRGLSERIPRFERRQAIQFGLAVVRNP